MTNRKQSCSVGDSISDSATIRTGVPQGSILGPLLFNIYINDIFILELKGELQCYADDAVLKYRAKSMNELQCLMQQDLELISKWFSANFMKINIDKTNYMIFSRGNNSQNLTLRIAGVELRQVAETDYLGLKIDKGLKWKNHIQKTRNKILPIIFALKKARGCLNTSSCWNIYNSFILPHLNYMNSIWGSVGASQLHCLNVLQNKAIKKKTKKCQC